jgi:transposase
VSSLIKKLLKIKDIVVQDVQFEGEAGGEQLIIKAKVPAPMERRCPVCGKKAKRYDAGRGRRRWRSLDMGTTKVFIEADAPRVCCKKHGVLTEWVSWARHDARFTYDFENTVAWLTLHSPISVVADCMSIAWNTVGPLAQRVHDDLKNQQADPYDGLACMGVDETSYKKGH